MRYQLITAILLILFANSFSADGPRKMVKLNMQNVSKQTIREALSTGIDVTWVDHQNKTMQALLTPTELLRLKQLGIPTEVLHHDADAFARELRRTDYLDRFRSFPQMEQEMRDIVAAYPDIARMVDIGDSYEKTVGRGGYDIWMMKISDNVADDEDEPEVLFMANMHAREIITPEIIMEFMHDVIDGYGNDPYITYLVDNREIWLCPSFNPDGHEYVLTGDDANNYNDPLWWRKNKRDNNNNDSFDSFADGVDLNRNFGHVWGRDNVGSSPIPSDPVYRGTEAFSEPESQAIRDFVNSHQFIASLSFHSYSQLWLYPWGYELNYRTPDDAVFVAIADSCVKYNGYHPELSSELYTVNGDTDDWLYAEQDSRDKIFAFTPEVGAIHESLGGWTGFFPDTMYIEKQIQENQGPMYYMAWAVGEEPIIDAQLLADIEDTDGPYRATCSITPAIPMSEPALLDTSALYLFYQDAETNDFDSVKLTATPFPSRFSALIPGQAEGTTIQYYFSAKDDAGRIGHAPRSAPMATYSFSIVADTIPPTIQHAPVLEHSLHDSVFEIKAYVQDDNKLSSVMLYYMQNWGDADSLQMRSGSQDHEYRAVIKPEMAAEGDVFQYWIVGTDSSKRRNSARLPLNGTFRFTIVSGYLFHFEANQAGFVTNRTSDWEWGRPVAGPDSAHSGQSVWGTRLDGNYSDYSDSWLDTPPVDLTTVSAAQLIFWHWYAIESSDGKLWDGGNVQLSADDGPFEIITPKSGYDGVVDPYNSILANQPAFGGNISNGNFWHPDTFDLTPYKGSQIVIRFHFASDDNTNLPGWYIDDLKINTTPVSDVETKNVAAKPARFALMPNFPNPFNPETAIQYQLPGSTPVKLTVYNMLGQEVRVLVSGMQTAGIHQVLWDARNQALVEQPSGVYVYRIEAGHFIQTRKMILLR